MSPLLHRALADLDSQFILDGGPAWRVERALDRAHDAGVEGDVEKATRDLEDLMRPAPAEWFGKRLAVLWTLFMAGRDADSRALTVWMSEVASLLGDLPFDIVAHSIDEAIKVSKHGFMPSVGEIRRIADPLKVVREQHIDRLTQMRAALADDSKRAEREARRAAAARHREHRPELSEAEDGR